MGKVVPLLSLLLLVGFTVASNLTACGTISGKYRKITVDVKTTLLGSTYAIGVRGSELEVSNLTGATLNTAQLVFERPESTDGRQNVGFYFGFFTGSLSASLESKVVSVSASLVEIAAAILNVFAYREGNNQPGFQYNIGDKFWDCQTQPRTWDCIVFGSVKSTSDLSPWGSITREEIPCPEPYNQTICKVHVLSTTSANNVLKVTLKLATQPIYVDGILVTPDYGKVDVLINYPWGTYPSDSKLGMTFASGGKASALKGSWGLGTVVDAAGAGVGVKSALVFTASGGKSSFFSWEGVAEGTAGASITTYSHGLSGETIAALDLSGKSGFEAIFLNSLKTLEAVYSAFGWKTQLIWFSWTENRPASVFWDPAIGSVDQAKATIQPTSGSTPLLMSCVVSVVLGQLALLI